MNKNVNARHGINESLFIRINFRHVLGVGFMTRHDEARNKRRGPSKEKITYVTETLTSKLSSWTHHKVFVVSWSLGRFQ